MGIRLTVTVLACGLGAFVGAYQWISWRGDAQPPSTRHEQVAGVTTVPQPASPARPSRTRPAAPLSARFTAGSEPATRSEEQTSELQSLMSISYAVFCCKKKNDDHTKNTNSRKDNA